MLLDFMVTILLVFALSGLITLLTAQMESEELSVSDFLPPEEEEPVEDDPFAELADELSRDEGLLAEITPIKVPHMDLPGAMIGGGAKEEACSKVVGTLVLKPSLDGDERRMFNRRLRDRRIDGIAANEERRMLQRRVWLRRREDRRRKKLVTVTEAAEMLGVSVEQMYKWLDQTDMPFYHVSEGNRKAIRFEVEELLTWHGAFKKDSGAL